MKEHDGCEGCVYVDKLEYEEPCINCKQSYNDDTIHPDLWTDRDMVNHPNHYCQEGSMECIDEMIAIFGKESVRTFCLLNVWKYRKRAVFKNGDEDMKKSDWYLKKYLEFGGDEERMVIV